MLKKIDKKTLYRYVIFILLIFMFFYPVRSGSNILEDILNLTNNVSDGVKGIINNGSDILTGRSLLAPVFESISDYLSSVFVEIGGNVVNAMVKSFSPSLQTFANITDGTSDSMLTDATAESGILFTGTIAQIIRVAKLIGLSIAFISLVFHLGLIMFGRAEAIKTNIPQLAVTFIVSVFLIYNAENIIWEISDIFGKIWQNGVMASTLGDLKVELSFDHFWKIMLFTKTFCTVPALYAAAFFIMLAIFWKMFKAFLRLYMSIIEHYLVMVLLMLFSPIIVPTIISPATVNMFKSYFRMIVSQFICMCITVIMMKIFVSTLINGGWTLSIINYIAGLAFLKVAQNVDMYMSKMGLDIVAGAGNFLSSARGSGMGLMNLIRTVGMIRNGIAGYGQSVADKAIANNDVTGFEKGEKIKAVVGKSSGQSYTETFAAQRNTKDNYQTYTSNNNESAISQALKAGHGMPVTMANQLSSLRYADGSTAASKVHTINQRGSSYEFLNKDGVAIATANASDGGTLHLNHADRTSYSAIDEEEGSYFIGMNGGSLGGADESAILSKDELRSYMEGKEGPIKDFSKITESDIAGGVKYGEQWTRIEYGNDKYRDVHVAYRGSGIADDLPKGYHFTNMTNSKGEEVRVAYSDLRTSKSDKVMVEPNPDNTKKAPKPTPRNRRPKGI